jgi:hypothetical protein
MLDVVGDHDGSSDGLLEGFTDNVGLLEGFADEDGTDDEDGTNDEEGSLDGVLSTQEQMRRAGFFVVHTELVL